MDLFTVGAIATAIYDKFMDVLKHQQTEEGLRIAKINLEASNRAEQRDIAKMQAASRSEERDIEKISLYRQKSEIEKERYIEEKLDNAYHLFTHKERYYTITKLRGLGMHDGFGYIMLWLGMNSYYIPDVMETLHSFIHNHTDADKTTVINKYLAVLNSDEICDSISIVVEVSNFIVSMYQETGVTKKRLYLEGADEAIRTFLERDLGASARVEGLRRFDYGSDFRRRHHRTCVSHMCLWLETICEHILATKSYAMYDVAISPTLLTEHVRENIVLMMLINHLDLPVETVFSDLITAAKKASYYETGMDHPTFKYFYEPFIVYMDCNGEYSASRYAEQLNNPMYKRSYKSMSQLLSLKNFAKHHAEEPFKTYLEMVKR
jgi:hypothetical protein